MKIGIVGLGDMGRLFAHTWAKAGYKVMGCDLPIHLEALTTEFSVYAEVEITSSGIEVVRSCDFILYSVEATKLKSVVQSLGPSTKYGAIVAGQTSIKAPEIEAFEQYLPKDTHIITLHALFGPNVSPIGQKLVRIKYRCSSQEKEAMANQIIQAIGSEVIDLDTPEIHDKMMADIQAITHIGFESIGTAFMHRKIYPWEEGAQHNGLDTIKLLLTLRIYSYKSHVYSGLALMNPAARHDVRIYAKSELDLFGSMISENFQKVNRKIREARDQVFKDYQGKLMLEDSIMSEYSLNPTLSHKPNSHLSLLSMVMAWKNLGTNPYQNLVCQTPPFRIRVGMAEYLMMNEDLLTESIHTAVYDKSIRQDDLAFHTAVHEWANIIEKGDFASYHQQFEATKRFLSPRLEEGRQKSTLLINRLHESRTK